MRVKIYQINHDRDANRVKFTGLDSMAKYQRSLEVDPSIYDEVFNAEIDYKGLEQLYAMFNTTGHPLHRGHSMSVSDVVVTEEGAFFCDVAGFAEIGFDESKTQKPADLLKVVYIEPGKPAYEAEIRHEMDALQRSVGGYVQQVNMEKGVVILCNEEGKLLGMPGNRRIGDAILAGPLAVVGFTNRGYRSLTESETNKMLERFAVPDEISQSEVQADMGIRFIPLQGL